MVRFVTQCFGALYVGVVTHFFTEVALQHFAHVDSLRAERYANVVGGALTAVALLLLWWRFPTTPPN